MEVSSRKRFDYLLGKLQEEAAEIVVETSKCLCFGTSERYTLEHPTNIERVRNEIRDLLTIVKLLEEDYKVDLGLRNYDKNYEEAKIRKLTHYMNLSESLGLLKGEE